LSVPAITYTGNPFGSGHGIGFGWDGGHVQMYVDSTSVGPIGHIDSVSAGNGLTGGGSSGAVSLAMSGSYSGNFDIAGHVGVSNGMTVSGTLGCQGDLIAGSHLYGATDGALYVGSHVVPIDQ